MRSLTGLLMLGVVAATSSSLCEAQATPAPQPRNQMTLSVGGFQASGYDFSQMFSVGLARQLNHYFLVEADLSNAKPKTSRDVPANPSASIVAHDGAVTKAKVAVPMNTLSIGTQLQLPAGKLAPYIGAGAGAYQWRNADFVKHTRYTAFVSGGVRVQVTESFLMRGDVRLRDDRNGSPDRIDSREYRIGLTHRF